MSVDNLCCVHLAIAEVVQALVVSSVDQSSPAMVIQVQITSQQDQAEDIAVPYKIKIASNQWMNYKQLCVDGCFENLTAVIRTSQSVSPGLFIQHQNLRQNQEYVQDKYIIEDGDNVGGQLCCVESQTMYRKTSSKFKMFFMVTGRREVMAEQSHSVHSYLQLLKLHRSQIALQFVLDVCGVRCESDFSCGVEYLSGSDDFQHDIVCSSQYYLRNKHLRCSAIHARRGDAVPFPMLGLTRGVSLPPLSAQTTAILVPYHDQTALSNHGFINLIFLGCDYIPLVPPVRQVGELWGSVEFSETFQLCECSVCAHHGALQSDIHYHVCVRNTEAKKARALKSFILHVFVSVDVTHAGLHPNSCSHKLSIINNLRREFPQWAVLWRDELQTSIDFALKSIWTKEFTVRNKTTLEKAVIHAVPVVTDSVMTVVMSSTNNHFRQACFHSLQYLCWAVPVMTVVMFSTNNHFRQTCFHSLQVSHAKELRDTLSDSLYRIIDAKYPGQMGETFVPESDIQDENCSEEQASQEAEASSSQTLHHQPRYLTDPVDNDSFGDLAMEPDESDLDPVIMYQELTGHGSDGQHYTQDHLYQDELGESSQEWMNEGLEDMDKWADED